MYKVGIIGAGVGGSYLSYILSKRGVDNIIFDFRARREKLCGGGVSYKTIAKFPVLNELPCLRKTIWKSTLISPKDKMVRIEFGKPLTIFNRRDLDYSFLKIAQESGAHFRKERVHESILERDHWRISTDTGSYRVEILVGADGALSGTRKRLRLFPKKTDYFLALECFLDVRKDFVTFKFFPDLKGYLWAFPRVDKLAVGIASNGCGRENYKDMEKKLLHFIRRYYPGQTKRISLRGAYIPFFSANDFQYMSICSKNWALIGDAATFVDPIGGEGIYYTMYSADILAGCIFNNELPLYKRLCMKHFGENLAEASKMFEYFYQAEFIEAMVALAEKSKEIRQILSEMVVGSINYLSWKRRCAKNFFKILANFFLNSDPKTRQDVITSLVKLFPKYHRIYSGHRIS